MELGMELGMFHAMSGPTRSKQRASKPSAATHLGFTFVEGVSVVH